MAAEVRRKLVIVGDGACGTCAHLLFPVDETRCLFVSFHIGKTCLLIVFHKGEFPEVSHARFRQQVSVPCR